MDYAITTQEQIDGAIEKKIDPIEIANVIYPRIEQAIELAKTPEEANSLQGKIASLIEYVKSELPRESRNTEERFNIVHPGEMLYLRAGAKAGALYDVLENKRPSGTNKSSESFRRTVGPLEAGFLNDRRATSFTRISKLHDEDWRTYGEETFNSRRQATASGLEHIWKMLYDENKPIPIVGKYRVIYADPPWSYGNLMPDYATEQADQYPTMSLEQICAMNVKDVADDNAVLFLWVTSPIIEESFEVIKAWGFKYKASFIWDKVKHNMGHYNSVRHELLWVCTRGSCQPDVMKLFDSVYTEERTEHSKKPEHFREVIDTLYPEGNRIELFARKKTGNWEVYGNQIS